MLMMPTCKDVSKLLSDRLDQRLGLMESVGLRLHLAMCNACSQVARQFALLRRGIAELPRAQDSTGSARK